MAMNFQEALARLKKRQERAKKRAEKRLLMRAPGRPHLMPIKKLIKQNDEIFSIYIRKRDEKRGCPFHDYFSPVQCCFHIIPRGKYWTRWDPINAFGSCKTCNYRFEVDHVFIHEAILKIIDLIGRENYDGLVIKSNVKEPIGRDLLLKIQESLIQLLELRTDETTNAQENG